MLNPPGSAGTPDMQSAGTQAHLKQKPIAFYRIDGNSKSNVTWLMYGGEGSEKYLP